MIDFGILLSNSLSQLIGLSAIFFALMALGLNMHFGYTGLLNFGQIGFALVGGYGMGIAVANYGLPLWVGVLVGMDVAIMDEGDAVLRDGQTGQVVIRGPSVTAGYDRNPSATEAASKYFSSPDQTRQQRYATSTEKTARCGRNGDVNPPYQNAGLTKSRAAAIRPTQAEYIRRPSK